MCQLGAGDLGKPAPSFQSKSENLRTRRPKVVRPGPGAGKDQCLSLISQAKKENSMFLCLFVGYVHTHCGRPLIQMPVSSRNTLADRNDAQPEI